MRSVFFALPFCSLFMAPFHADALTSPRLPERRSAAVADDNKPLPTDAEMQRLAKEDPVALLENGIRRYQREVKGYTLTFEKQERLGGVLHKKELIDVAFREDPHGVLMRWTEGARRVQGALYVEGENNGMSLIRPNGRLLGRVIVSKDPEGEEAKEAARYSLKDFGMKKVAERILKTWKDARANGGLFVEFLGEQKVKGAGERTCYVLKRSRFQKAEGDGVLEVTVFIDKETWLQVGSIAKGKNDELIGAYYYRDIKFNPTFKDDQFKRDALSK